MPTTSSPPGPVQVDSVRRFGRFYTRHLGVLREGLLALPYSLTEARILWELGTRAAADARTLAVELGLDPGYLSRVIGGLDRRGLVERSPSPHDGRVKELRLTGDGLAAFQELDRASSEEVRAVLHPLTTEERERLVRAMGEIESLLGQHPGHAVPYVLRTHQPGDLGWVVERHGALYAREFGWDVRFEGLVAEIVAEFACSFDPRRERCWIAEREGQRVGSVFLVRKSDDEAQLRLLFVDPSARGLGIGRRLVSECSRFARDVGYRTLMLWTNANLVSARRIYEAEGYRLIREEPHESFGHHLVGQFWELEL